MIRTGSLAFLLVLSGIAAPAGAAWTPPTTVNGTTLRGEPSCASLGGGAAVCGALSSKGSVVVSRYNGTSWTAWKTLAGTVSSPPSCTDDGAGKVVCGVRAVNGQFQYSVYDPVTALWTKSLKVAGSALYSGPSCAKVPGGKVLCAARSNTGGLTYSVFDGVAWSPFAAVAASILSRPACSADESGALVCVVINPANGLSAIRYIAGAWSPIVSIGGVAGSDDVRCNSVAATSPYRVFCFVAGTNGVLYVNPQVSTGGWGGWGSLGVQTNYGGTCGVTGAGQVACGLVATVDNALYTTTWNGSVWSAWAKQGGTGTGTPSCIGLGNGKVACVFPGLDNKMYYSVGP